MRRFTIIFFAGILMSSCASTKLTHVWVDEASKGTSFSKYLVIGISDQEGIRRSFEENFVEQLKQNGVVAVSSADALDIPADKKLEKEPILEVVRKYQNDAVIITHLIGVEKRQVYRSRPPLYRGYYDYYHYAYGYVHRPGYYTTHEFVKLETNVYDVKTEKPVWSGQSETWEPESDRQLLDEVIKMVVKEMHKNGLLPNK
jgi:hypothetical protein